MRKGIYILIIQVLMASSLLGQTMPVLNEMELNTKIEDLLGKMTLEEKASLCSGRDSWSSRPVERLDIPWVWMSDGPHGLRRAPSTNLGGYGDQHPATCFPTASALASSWDTELLYHVGQTLGEECQALDVNILLGPGVNIKRHPLCGRNFEFFSEDPILAGEIAASYINGVQSQGVGTSLKHYALNNEETNRMIMSSEADMRTMRELYLVPFEIAVKKANPWTVMASYNRINGVYGTQNSFLLTDVLRKDWGYTGMVISDWISVIDRVEGLKAGMNIEMPGSSGVNDKLIVEAVKSGKLDVKILDESTRQILRIVLQAKSLEKEGVSLQVEKDHAIARKVAGETITLLKNEDQVLPIEKKKYKKIAVIGEFAIHPRYQGNGSSEVKPALLDSALAEIEKIAGKDFTVTYAQGYSLRDDNDLSLIEQAKKIAQEADIALIFAGLPLQYESEGIDRTHINMPASHNKLISAVAAVQPKTVVMLSNGSAVAMPWNNEVKGIVETWLGGQAGAGAAADVLFGKVNPSGKLAESFPQKLEDTPAFLNFPGEERTILYGERMFVGYRYYDIKKIEPLYPFGFGLSYTTFTYSGLTTSAAEFSDKDILTISCKIKNTGAVFGKEIVQMYVSDKISSLQRPVKELKKFAKVELKPGEEKTVTFELNSRDFSYYDSHREMWVAETGDFDVMVGASSRDIREVKTVKLNSTQKVPNKFDEYTFFIEYRNNPLTRDLTNEYFADWIKTQGAAGQPVAEIKISNEFLVYMPIIKFPYLTNGIISKEKVDEFILKAQELDK